MERIITSGGLVRRYRVFVPHTAQPMPVVLDFHGLGDSASKHAPMSGFETVALDGGFVVVTPDAFGPRRSWRIPDAQRLFPSVVDDVEFVKDILRELGNDLCLDSQRIFAAGFSNGAYFASLLACTEPGLLLGIAPVAGLFFPEDGCSNSISMQVWHDSVDDVVPLDGGDIFGLFYYRGVNEYLSRWQGLSKSCVRVERQDHGAQITDISCSDGATLQLVLLNDLGHIWPRAEFTGRSAADLIWEFFGALPSN